MIIYLGLKISKSFKQLFEGTILARTLVYSIEKGKVIKSPEKNQIKH
jgi:hypothetical protein